MPQNYPNQSQKQLRKTLRKQRLALPRQQRQQAGYQAFRQLAKLPFSLKKPKGEKVKIGIYLDAFGEMPVQPIIDWAKRHQFDLYLPVVIKPNTALKFVKMSASGKNSYQKNNWRLIRHSLGMKQPANIHNAILAHQLDVLFMPLVAVDKFGYRMGMGGGFYDRTLANCKTKPIKIGWAYDFQFVEKLETQPWDVALDFAIFPSGLKKFKRYLTGFSENSAVGWCEATQKEIKGVTPNIVEADDLPNDLIAQVMNIDKLADLLQRANAFGVVYSEDFLS